MSEAVVFMVLMMMILALFVAIALLDYTDLNDRSLYNGRRSANVRKNVELALHGRVLGLICQGKTEDFTEHVGQFHGLVAKTTMARTTDFAT
jgi:hypothetical protein